MEHDKSIQPNQFLYLIFSCEAFTSFIITAQDGFHVMNLSVRKLVAIY